MKKLFNQNTSNKIRIGWIDIAKGIAIICMIIGHGPRAFTFEQHLIYSFHMPLFFILSGYTFRNLSLKDFLKKSFRKLILPYIYMCGCIGFIYFIAFKFQLTFTYAYQQSLDLTVKDFLLMCFYGGAADFSFLGRSFKAIGVIWFLPCLFLSKLYICLIENILHRDNLKHAVILLLVIIGELLSRFKIYLPLGIDIACVAAFFVYIGMELQKINIEKSEPKLFLFCIAIEILFLLENKCLSLGGRNYFLLSGFMAATCTSLLIFRLCIFLQKFENKGIQFLRFCGNNSLILLCMHKIEGMLFVLITLKFADIMPSIILERSIIIFARVSTAVMLTFLWNYVTKKIFIERK